MRTIPGSAPSPSLVAARPAGAAGMQLTAAGRRALAVGGMVVLALVAPSTGPLAAQTVRPAVVEYPVHGRGTFSLINESLFPLTVVLEPRGFAVAEDGTLSDLPFDSSNVELRLSAMSFRIPPLATYTVSYEAKARRLPAWFMVLAAMTGARTNSGINVRLELPHVVYLLQKDPLQKSVVVLRPFPFDSAQHKAVLELENTGHGLGRVLASELSTSGRRGTPFGGFPLFPQSRRRVEVPWDGAEAPDRVLLRFANFVVDERRDGVSR
jgi:hypothetical protein